MDAEQDVVRCILCKTFEATMHCEFCQVNLCKNCVENHLSASPKAHKMVSFKQYLATLVYPRCRKHPIKRSKLYCEQCDIPICERCISSQKHLGHTRVDILKKIKNEKEVLQIELQELEKYIYPKYKEIASNIPGQKADLRKKSQKLKTAINRQGEIWHREIDNIIRNKQSSVEEIESKHLLIINKQEHEIACTISKITQRIADLRELLDSKDVHLISEYKSRNAEFRRLPLEVKVSFPIFRAQEINTDQLTEEFGSLSALSFTTEEQGYIMPPQVDQTLIDVPRVITAIKTNSEYGLYGVACLSDVKVWARGGVENMITLLNLWEEKVDFIQSKSGNCPEDISVTRSGDLVYTDKKDRTVNIVENTEIQTVIRLRGWIPHGVCSTSSGDLLVVVDRDHKDDDVHESDKDDKQTKVVRYSGSTEKQNIQFNDQGQPLYSSGVDISENKNLDICVSDYNARAVVVVNQAGKLRFTYTGPPSTTRGPFSPFGITTDSQCRILIADHYNDCIHILDQDGQFLRYIDNCNFDRPYGVCVDIKNNLFVAEETGTLKKIQYYM